MTLLLLSWLKCVCVTEVPEEQMLEIGDFPDQSKVGILESFHTGHILPGLVPGLGQNRIASEQWVKSAV